MSLAIGLNNLASMYMGSARYRDALPLFKRAMEICRSSPDGKSFVPRAMNNMAECYRNLGDEKRAEEMYLESLALHEQMSGTRALKLAPKLNNLATLYASQGRMEESEALYKRVIGILLATVGPDHPNTIDTQQNYAHMLRNVWRSSEAKAMDQAAQKGLTADPTFPGGDQPNPTQPNLPRLKIRPLQGPRLNLPRTMISKSE